MTNNKEENKKFFWRKTLNLISSVTLNNNHLVSVLLRLEGELDFKF